MADNETEKLTGRGGPGRGQGRHPLSFEEPTIDTSITVRRSELARLQRLGAGNVSAGVREALRRLDECEDAGLPEGLPERK